MKLTRILAASLLATLASGAAHASEYLTGTLGWYDAIRQDQEATLFGAEYRFNPVIASLRPIVGGFITSHNSRYAYLGAQYDIALIPDRLYLSPNFAPGVYAAGDGKRLGGAIEFRSGISLDYQFQNQQRVGFGINHLSNASIYNHNPGVETLFVTYSIPTGNIFSGR